MYQIETIDGSEVVKTIIEDYVEIHSIDEFKDIIAIKKNQVISLTAEIAEMEAVIK